VNITFNVIILTQTFSYNYRICLTCVTPVCVGKPVIWQPISEALWGNLLRLLVNIAVNIPASQPCLS